MSQTSIAVLYIPALLLALVLHEVGHALVAFWGGDDTARRRGRVSLNPLAHIDPFGTVILPAVLLLSKAPFLFGWAKPVPVDPSRLRNRWWNVAVSLAGPGANLLLIVVSALALKALTLAFAPERIADNSALLALFLMGNLSIQVNLVLMLFNLLPLPPLDGSHIVREIFFPRSARLEAAFRQIGAVGLIVILVAQKPLGMLFGRGLEIVSAVMEYTLGLPLMLPR